MIAGVAEESASWRLALGINADAMMRLQLSALLTALEPQREVACLIEAKQGSRQAEKDAGHEEAFYR